MWNGRLLSEIKRPKNQATTPHFYTKKKLQIIWIWHALYATFVLTMGWGMFLWELFFYAKVKPTWLQEKAFPIASDKIYYSRRCQIFQPKDSFLLVTR